MDARHFESDYQISPGPTNKEKAEKQKERGSLTGVLFHLLAFPDLFSSTLVSKAKGLKDSLTFLPALLALDSLGASHSPAG